MTIFVRIFLNIFVRILKCIILSPCFDDDDDAISDLGGEVLEFFVAPKNGFLNIGGG